MKVFGYSKVGRDSVISLTEVTFSAEPKELRLLAKFLEHCAQQIECNPNDWEHSHFSDFERSVTLDSLDVIVYYSGFTAT